MFGTCPTRRARTLGDLPIMPELPDLEVIREFLAPRLAGVAIASADVRRPLVVRTLLETDGSVVAASAVLVGRRFLTASRHGKFLLLPLDDGTFIVINPMLAGRLRYGHPLPRHRKRDVLVLGLEDGHELRYHDAKDMGKVYLTPDMDRVPGFRELGPDATDPDLTESVFRERLRRHHGEIKGILTNQAFVAGIGNAYADEILWHTQIYPMRRRPTLDDQEVSRLYASMRTVLAEAIETLRERVGDQIDFEVRDFLAVHGRAGQPCPRCGAAISEVTLARRSTHFCRTCQPGLMVGRRSP